MMLSDAPLHSHWLVSNLQGTSEKSRYEKMSHDDSNQTKLNLYFSGQFI